MSEVRVEIKELRTKEILSIIAGVQFRTIDTPQSSRTLTHYQEKGILLNDRKEGDGWRTFTFGEMLWLSIIEQLREFGYPIEKIKSIRDGIKDTEKQNDGKGYFEFPSAVSIAAKDELFFVVTIRGTATFYTDASYKMWQKKDSYMREPIISIPLGDIIRSIWNDIPDEEKLEYNLPEFEHITKQERKIINEVREGKCKAITIKFKDNKIIRISKLEKKGNKEKLIDIIKESKYGILTVLYQDGKVVNISNEPSIKI